jgi:glycosyltransferase involved in cell wall biosynthesis
MPRIAITLPHSCYFSPDKVSSFDIATYEINKKSDFRDDIHIFCNSGKNHFAGFNIEGIDPDLDKDQRIQTISDRLNRLKPDLIECHQHARSFQKIVQTFDATPSVFVRHNKINCKPGIFGIRKRRRLKKFDRIIFVSHDARKNFDECYSNLSTRSLSITNGIDCEKWHARQDLKQKIISFVGRPTAEKGFPQFCKAAMSILAEYPDWKIMIIAGEWDYFKKAKKYVDPLINKYKNRAELLKSISPDRVIEKMKPVSIAVVPTTGYETFGLVAAEAHAAGAAVISSGSGGLKEVSGDHAIYLEAVTPENLAQAASYLINHPGELQKLAKSGQKYVRDHHDISVKTEKLDNLRDLLINHY